MSLKHTHLHPDTSVTFVYYAPHASQVSVLGNFSNWEHWGMTRGDDGCWYLTTPPCGEIELEYKFNIDGYFANDPSTLRTTDNENNNSTISLTGNRGNLFHTGFFSETLQEFKKYVVYLPPNYAKSNRSYPVLYLSGGLLDYEMSWHERGRIGDVADHLTAHHQINEMIIVMSEQSQTWTEPGLEHLYYNYITIDLMGHIEHNYRVDSTKRGIEGLSIGAHWALKIGLANPYDFCSVASMSCPIDGQLYDLATENKSDILRAHQRIRLNCGNGEGEVVPSNFQYHEHLKTLGLPSECYVGDGPHDWPLWQNEIFNSLRFHSHSFSA